MGTNFYFKAKHDYIGTHIEPELHIGKRSAAGWYCWKCEVTLCKAGEKGIHFHESEWFDKCPLCGKKLFISPCCSFTWAINSNNIWNLDRHNIIVDEYGREYMLEDFYRILEECPIQYHDSIGQEFS